MDFGQLLHNRWVWAAGGVGALAGTVVLIRRRSGGGGSAASSAGAPPTPGYSAGGVGGFNSTGTDVASWLGSQQGVLQTQLDQYAKQLTDTLAPYTPGATGTGTATTGAGPFANYTAGTDLYTWADANITAPHKTAGDALNQLRALNPGLAINWAGAAGTTKTPTLSTGQSLRIA